MILSNFCMKHKDVQNYRKVGLVALLSLLTIPESDESAAIGILLVHLTKLDLPDARLNSYFGNFRKLTVKKTLESHQKKWIELAASLLKHPEVNSFRLRLNCILGHKHRMGWKWVGSTGEGPLMTKQQKLGCESLSLRRQSTPNFHLSFFENTVNKLKKMFVLSV